MRKYVYENATVYITEPNEAQAENIRRATEKFVCRLAKKGLLYSDKRRDNHGTGRVNSDARKRSHEVKK